MSPRNQIFAAIRRALGVSGAERFRRELVADRLGRHPVGIVPKRGNLPAPARLALFRSMLETAAGTLEWVADAGDVPHAVGNFLRAHNLPGKIRRGEDARLTAMPWAQEPLVEVLTGPAQSHDVVGVSHAFGGVAESGTVMLLSGRDNPTTLNFLPDTHIVVLAASDIVGDYESLWERLRAQFGPGHMPRTVNLITGPSRSADIEQTLILGAHGPRRFHVIVVGWAE